ncbi:2-hydroxyacid dehydrogenase [Vulcanisaeta souniana]|uniref:3-phosphoglycerate dehydrogenase n=1 Tax=Vulcanisaeta souniana JCM 11219 TaxID=1293586 RepID=A0A830EEV6_9CREN|nr:2-hydroxyacid dehydrogenase [Vulcanisaeta souniana]BDR91836.1 3-phosphoglycerate dehydrogenase [Vulcanisaeta souniana JCM 11219]GGI69969.1 3-phosphoglycerate dehydrogenase [Vulcanisaeta souniana JCM 11219]
MPTVIVSTIELPEKAKELLRDYDVVLYELPRLGKEELASALSRAEVLMCWCGREFDLTRSINSMPRLRVIQTFSAGVDHLPFPVIPSNIEVYSNAGAYSVPVAEHAWAMILTLAKGLHRPVLNAREYLGNEITSPRRIIESTLLVLGTGGIGLEIARIGKEGFRTHNIGINRSGRPTEYFDEVYPTNQLLDALPRADIVAIALPLNKYTKALVSEKELKALKHGAIVVNVGRGDVVKEEDLYKVLKERQDIRFGTDVWWMHDGHEEIPPMTPLTTLPNFLGTPHIAGGAQREIAEYAMIRAVENVIRYLRGETPMNKVSISDYV